MKVDHTQALQALEQQLQQIINHKQSLRTKLLELDSAIKAVASSPTTYRAIGNILVAKDPKDLAIELEQEHEALKVRLGSFEKQEEKLSSKKKELQEQIMKELQGGKHE